jgi:hypothetical protein
LEERSDDALCRAPAVPGILPPGKIVEGEKAAGVYEGAEPPVLPLTGHASPKMLKKYIKADTLEVVEKLTDKYEYFR